MWWRIFVGWGLAVLMVGAAAGADLNIGIAEVVAGSGAVEVSGVETDSRVVMDVDLAVTDAAENSAVGDADEGVSFDREVVELICAEMGVVCEITEYPAAMLAAALAEAQVDAIAVRRGAVKTKSAVRSKPYFRAGAKFVVRREAKFKISYSALAGRVIGAQAGSVYENFLTKEFKGAEVRAFESLAAAHAQLRAGGVDAVLGGRRAQEAAAQADKTLRTKGAFYSKAPYFEARFLAVRRGQDELKTQLNKAIVRVQKNQSYQDILARHF